MKQMFFFALLAFGLSCSNQVVPKPDRLLSLDQMESIVYDMAVLNAAVAADRSQFKAQSITPLGYIYKKYEIDSTVYAQNDLYYASKPLEYEVIYRRVEKRLQALKTTYDQAAKASSALK